MKLFRKKDKTPERLTRDFPADPPIRRVRLFEKPFPDQGPDVPSEEEKVFSDGSKRVPAHRSAEGMPLIWTTRYLRR